MNRTITALCFAAALLTSCSKSETAWTPLFNGENLDNWEKYLGPGFEGHDSLTRAATPDNVFSVVDLDGEKVIRISGEVFGSLATRDTTLGNFHARLVMKWGEKVTKEFNCGFLYYGHGPLGACLGTWKSCVECQLQHGNMGALYMIGEDIVLNAEAAERDSNYTYTPGAPSTKFGKAVGRCKILASENAENPVGEWNTVEIYCCGQQTVHVVNGRVTMRTGGIASNASGQEQPLTSGCLQLQSEGGELFVKSVEIQHIDEIPAELLNGNPKN